MDFSRSLLTLKKIEDANGAPPIRFYPTEDNKKFLATLCYSLVILDSMNLGPIFIQSHLQKIFPFPNWH
jgi:hypothetical protein